MCLFDRFSGWRGRLFSLEPGLLFEQSRVEIIVDFLLRRPCFKIINRLVLARYMVGCPGFDLFNVRVIRPHRFLYWL